MLHENTSIFSVSQHVLPPLYIESQRLFASVTAAQSDARLADDDTQALDMGGLDENREQVAHESEAGRYEVDKTGEDELSEGLDKLPLVRALLVLGAPPRERAPAATAACHKLRLAHLPTLFRIRLCRLTS